MSQASAVIKSNQLTQFGLELGVFVICACFVSSVILLKIKGSLSRLESFFANKSWEFIKISSNLTLYAKIFQYIVIFMIAWPLLSLLAWVISLFEMNKNDYLPPLTVLLIGFSIIFAIMGVMYLRWNNFKMSKLSLLLIVLSIACFFAYQILAIVQVKDTNVSFLGLSAVFLTANAFVMIILVFMVYSKDSITILEVIKKYVKEGPSLSLNDVDNLEELITKETQDPKYQPQQGEIFQLFTLCKNVEEFSETALAGGMQRIFLSRNPSGQKLLLLILYLISLGILIAYSIIGYKYTPEKLLSCVTSIAVVTTDFILYLLMCCQLAYGPVVITILLVGFRAFLFGFGGNQWFMGYCLLYIFLCIFLSIHIICPEFVYCFATCIFISIMVYLGQGNSENVPTEGFVIYGKVYAFWTFGLASLFITLAIFCYLATLRIYNRKINKVKETFKCFAGCSCFDTYYIFLFTTYICLIIIGVLWSSINKEYFILFSCLFLPLIYECLLVIYYNWKMNDYRILADVIQYNKKMKKFKEDQLFQQNQKLALRKMLGQNIVGVPQQQGQNNNNISQITANDQDKSVDKLLNDLENQNQPGQIQKQPGQNQAVGQNDKKTMDEQSMQLALQAAMANDNEEEEGGPTLFLLGTEINIKQILSDYNEMSDWRQLNISILQAYRENKLMPTDKRIVNALFLMILLMIGYSIGAGLTSNLFPLLSTTISICIISLFFIFMPLKFYFSTLQPLILEQKLLIIIGFLINFGYGFFYFIHYKTNDIESNPSVYFLIYFLFLVPWLVSFLIFILKWRDNLYKLDTTIKIFGGISIVFALGLSGFLMWSRGFGAGGGVLGFWALLYYSLVVFYIYNSNNKSMPRSWFIATVAIIALICLSALVFSLIFDSFSDFLGFSIFYLTLNFILLAYSYSQIMIDLAKRKEEPIFTSPWMFPIYKYDSKTASIKIGNSSFSLFICGCLLFLIWSITLAIWLSPVFIGISVSCIVEIFLFSSFIFISTWSPLQLGQSVSKINPTIVKQSWLQAKKSFLQSKGVSNNNDLISYEYCNKQFNDRQKDVTQAQSVSKQKTANYYQEMKELYNDMFDAEKKLIGSFNDEINLMVHFQLMIVLLAEEEVKKDKKDFLNFITNSKKELLLQGIILLIDPQQPLETKYASVMNQIERLGPESTIKVQNLRKAFIEKQLEAQRQQEAKEKEEEIKKKQREEEIRKKLQEQKQQQASASQQIDVNKPLKDIPDCPEKLLLIIKKFEQQGQKYVDEQFATDNSVLTQDSVPECCGWQRPGPGAELFKDNYSPMDIRQGYLGDCYLLSAISVLGNKFIEDVFMINDENLKKQSKRFQCGAYIVKFIMDQSPVYVIVDDQLPIDRDKQWLFGQSEDQNEIWPCILEKAYAKMYGGYNQIEGGKVAYVLSEFTGGLPDEIILKDQQKAIETFWNSLTEYKNMGYIMGAGSPSHEQGDKATSEDGIVFGHAYSVIDIKDIDNNRLIKLRNPHGNRSAEWKGDWSDGSLLWNQRLKAILKEEFEEDGMFYMSIDDFVYEYRALYLCRIFTPPIWHQVDIIKGAWVGEKAAGLPTKNNPRAKMNLNPTYGITVSKKSTLFVSLRIKETKERMKGKYMIYFLIQKNGGKRVTNMDSSKIVGTNGALSPMQTTTAQITLEAPTFPYTFSLMVATMNPGEESAFSIQLFCTDSTINVIDDSQFDVQDGDK